LAYEALRLALITRRYSLGLPRMAVDAISGLQDGYTAKIECGAKRLSPLSLSCLLGALGLELLVVPNTMKHLPNKTGERIDAEPARSAFEKLRERYRAMGRRSGEARRAMSCRGGPSGRGGT